MAIETGITCVHVAAGLCKSCQAEYDEDPSAYWEYGDHPAGLARWRDLCAEIAAEVASMNARIADDGEILTLDELPPF
jgi:hypothetical protein